MSNTETEPASTESEIPEGMTFHGESATPKEQPSIEAQTNEIEENVSPEKDVTPNPNDSKPESKEADSKEHIAARNLAIENRKLKREAREREAADNQAPTPKVEPQATPKAEVPENLLDGPEETADYIQSAISAGILKDRQEQDALRQTNSAVEKNNSFIDKLDALAVDDKEFSDLMEVSGAVQLSDVLKEQLMESNVGAEAYKHILENPDVLLKINSLSFQFPAAAKSQFKAIEASIKTQSQGQTQQHSATSVSEPMKVAGGSAPSEESEIPPGMKFF